MTEGNGLAKVKTVAKAIGLSESFVRHRIMIGDFPGVKRFGRAVRIQISDVEMHYGCKLDLVAGDDEKA